MCIRDRVKTVYVCVCVCDICVGVQGDLKKITVENLDTYIHKDLQLPIMLDRLLEQLH